ncbi:hypothetical protein AYI68_g6660 [Smittium mucronatum]|uniref:F-box domain-containing protein n=1 Tax=Smittium mucronatum TaxID=133383 RepID=A0A1R0GQW5_9FUNG|nr:hypothetical protein AYI68_g6660 [Smittium mucronatum]
MEQILPSEVIERIFVFSQNPELRFISRSFHKISKTTKVRSEFFLFRFGPKNCFDFKKGLPAKFPKLFVNENLSLSLVNLGASIDPNQPKWGDFSTRNP